MTSRVHKLKEALSAGFKIKTKTKTKSSIQTPNAKNPSKIPEVLLITLLTVAI